MEMERRLYDAALKGDVNTLHELVHEDELILDRTSLTCFNETPLHIAAMRGHSEFVKVILKHNPQLAKELDSRKSAPLHIASTKGYTEIVKELLGVDPDMCFAGDIDGKNPLHLAAMKDRIEVLKLLIQTRPHAACKKTNRGENILHLCVKHGQLDALKMVLEMIVDGNDEMVADVDCDGNTILHLAVLGKQIETVKHLVALNKISLNDKNGRGETALDILSQSQTYDVALEISGIIKKAGGLRANHIDSHYCCTFNLPSIKQETGQTLPTQGRDSWLTHQREAIMIVASLIATMAFQAGVNPAGGVWQEDKEPHRAGESIMAHRHGHEYKIYIRANTIAFISSLSTILLLISGLPFRRKLFLWLLMGIMWLTITSSALTYGISIIVLTPEGQKNKIMRREILCSSFVWSGVMALVLLGNFIRLFLRLMQRRGAIEAMWQLNGENRLDHQYHCLD